MVGGKRILILALLSVFSSGPLAYANPIIIELGKGIAYGVGSMAGKELYEQFRGTSRPESSPATPPSPHANDPRPTPQQVPQVDVSPPVPPNGLLARFRNSSGEQITLQFYSLQRRNIWPHPNRAYSFAPGNSGEIRIGCVPGERICYGAWSGGKSWGVGYHVRRPCEKCCATCGSMPRSMTLL